MEDSLIVIFSIILAVILMFVFPVMDTWERQDDISYMSVYADVVEFVDAVRNTGKITPTMYNQFLQGISATGNLYEITMEHRKHLTMFNDYKKVYTNEIESKLNNGESYLDMKAGDYFYVSLKNTNKTQSTLLKEVVYASTQETFKIGVPYGGMVRSTPSGTEDVSVDVVLDNVRTCSHNWLITRIITQATCQHDGEVLYTCSICGVQQTRIVKQTDHKYDMSHAKVVVPATCTKAEISEASCMWCDNKTQYTSRSALGHDWGRWVTVTSPTCQTTGTSQRLCKRLNCNEKDTKVLAKVGHSYTSLGTIVSYATCTKAAVYNKKCLWCNSQSGTKTYGSPLGHSYGKGAALSSCSWQYKCSRCGNVAGVYNEHNITKFDAPDLLYLEGPHRFYCPRCNYNWYKVNDSIVHGSLCYWVEFN